MASLDRLEGQVDLKEGDTSGIDKAEKKIGGLNEKTVDASKKIALGVAAAGAAVVAFGVQSVGAFFGSQEASTKLATNLLNVKGNTEQNVDSLESLASALQNVGVVEDDVIKAGMSQLATFNLQGETIAAVTPKILDMATQTKGYNVTAEDMVGLNNLVGKVLTGNVGALTRYGVTLSDNQAELLKQGTESEKAAILNEVLAQNFGKVNEALRKTPQGRITALKNNFGDLQEGVGEFIVSALGPLLDKFDGFMQQINEAGGLLEFLKQQFEQHKVLIFAIAGAIVAALIPAMVAFGVSTWTAMAPLLPFVAAGLAVGAVIGLLVKWFNGNSESATKFREILKTIHDFFVANILPVVQKVWSWLKEKLMKAWEDLKAAIEPHLPMLKNLAIIIGVVLLAPIIILIAVIAIVIGIFALLVIGIMKVVTWILNLVTWFKELYQKGVEWVANLVNGIIDWFKQLPHRIAEFLVELTIKAALKFAELRDKAISFGQGIVDWFKGLPGRLMDAVRGLAANVLNPIISAANKLPGINIPLLAQGVEGFGGGMAIVGEQGPEAVFLPQGSTVVSNREAREALGSGGGKTININMNVEAKDIFSWDSIAERVGYLIAMAS